MKSNNSVSPPRNYNLFRNVLEAEKQLEDY